MSYMLRAMLSIAVGVGAVLGVLSLASAAADIVCGSVVAVALLVFIRAILTLAGESGDQPPASGTAR